MKAIEEYTDPSELRQLMANALRLGDEQIYWQAFSRLCLISGRDDPDPLVREAEAVERKLAAILAGDVAGYAGWSGLTRKAARTPCPTLNGSKLSVR